MLKINNKMKVFLIAFGVFLSLIFCGSFLYLTGLVNRSISLPKYNLTNIDKESLIVFCFGDSFTYGIGAGFEKSYPAQLQNILKKEGFDVKVFNFGVPGYNSSQTLHKFKKTFSQLTPDIVILMSGSNDNWNFSSLVLHRKGYLFRRYLMNSHLYPSVVRFISNFQEKFSKVDSSLNPNICKIKLAEENNYLKLIEYGNILRYFSYYEDAERFYYKAMFKTEVKYLPLIELGRCYKLDKQYKKAIVVFSRLLKLYPENEAVFLELQDLFTLSGNTRDKVLLFETMSKLFPGNQRISDALIDAYVHAAGELSRSNDLINAKALYAKAAELDSEGRKAIPEIIKSLDLASESKKRYLTSNFNVNIGHPLRQLKGFLLIKSSFSQSFGLGILFGNFAEMIEICQKNNVKVIISEYPSDYEGTVCKAVQKIVKRYEIPIIEHNDIFNKLLISKPYEYYFVSKKDSHCTQEGYRIMAENIARAIIDLIEN